VSQVISFESYTPAPRYDAIPWTEVRIEEGTALAGPWTLIDTIALSPVDANPAQPAARSFTTENATDTDGLWYRLIFADASGDTLGPIFPVQNIVSRPHYATVEELALLLRVRVSDRRDALQRVLDGAALEIDQELGRSEPYTSPPALVVEVNLERAVEHWQQMQSPFGILGLGGDSGPAFVSRDSWDRHAHKLAPLKETFGLA
jgi:hypothetical protein